MKTSRFVATTAALLALTASSSLAGGRYPGSVLVFPVHRSGPSYFTVLSVTNTNLDPVPFDKSTLVHYQYVNVNPDASDPFRPKGCTIFNRIETLTPGDTLSVLTRCHNAFNPSGQEGYVVVSAQDPGKFNTPWSFNYLVGSELVINSSGVMYSLNAIPFGSRVAKGDPTDLDGDGNLDFDASEYEPTPDWLYIDSFIAGAQSHLTLLNLTGRDVDENTVQFLVWNDNEFPLSTTLTFNCWFDQPLSKISTLFTDSFLKNNTPHDPDELDIDCAQGNATVETGWAIIDSSSVRTPGGNTVADDGALLGAITSGTNTRFAGGHLLWESEARQMNGEAFAP